MSLFVVFSCLVAVGVLELVTCLPEPQTFGQNVAGASDGFAAGNTNPIVRSVFGNASVSDVIIGGISGALEVIDERNSNHVLCTPRKPHTKCQISDDWMTTDTDGDGHVDSCDNCPHVSNVDQADKDGNRVGDACDTHTDYDKDGVPDGTDNCREEANHDQSDVDGDGVGDECDDDADNDGISNLKDNCWLTPNPNQEDTYNDGFGDACRLDIDGDCVTDLDDICPNDPHIHKPDLTHFHKVSLDKVETGQSQANFEVSDNGTTVTQTINSKPGLMFGQHSLSDLDYSGTFRVDDSDDDYVGFIFGYKDAKNFYVVMWKRGNQTSFECETGIVAEPGVQLKRVHSNIGPSCNLQDSLWASTTRSKEVTVLWKDPSKIGWERNQNYHWELIHRPSKGLIRFRFLNENGVVVDSGDIYDHNIKSGFIGVYCHSQEDITWSNIQYRCNAGTPTWEDFPYTEIVNQFQPEIVSLFRHEFENQFNPEIVNQFA